MWRFHSFRCVYWASFTVMQTWKAYHGWATNRHHTHPHALWPAYADLLAGLVCVCAFGLTLQPQRFGAWYTTSRPLRNIFDYVWVMVLFPMKLVIVCNQDYGYINFSGWEALLPSMCGFVAACLQMNLVLAAAGMVLSFPWYVYVAAELHSRQQTFQWAALFSSVSTMICSAVAVFIASYLAINNGALTEATKCQPGMRAVGGSKLQQLLDWAKDVVQKFDNWEGVAMRYLAHLVNLQVITASLSVPVLLYTFGSTLIIMIQNGASTVEAQVSPLTLTCCCVCAAVLARADFSSFMSFVAQQQELAERVQADLERALRDKQSLEDKLNSVMTEYTPSYAFDAATPADKLVSMLNGLLNGVTPTKGEVQALRIAVTEGHDIYHPLDLADKLVASRLDTDVARSLQATLGIASQETSDGPKSDGSMLSTVQEDVWGDLMRTKDAIQEEAGMNETGEWLCTAEEQTGESLMQSALRRVLGCTERFLNEMKSAPSMPLPARRRPPARTASSILVFGGNEPESPFLVSKKSTASSLDPDEGLLDTAAALLSAASVCRRTRTLSYRLLSSDNLESDEVSPFHMTLHLLDQVETVLKTADTYAFNAFELAEASKGRPLSSLAVYLFHTSGLMDRFKIDSRTMCNFIVRIEDGYKDNKYHNKTHAANVLQRYHVILKTGAFIPSHVDHLTLLAAYIAAAIHDYDHLGTNNDFLINTRAPLAIVYNDKTPLENHHLASAFALMQKAKYSILENLDRHEYDKLRKLVIDLVMATDMKQHFSILSHFKTCHNAVITPAPSEAGGFSRFRATSMRSPPAGRKSLARPSMDLSRVFQSVATPEDATRILALQVALKAADIGHLAEPLETHKRWVIGLEEELFLQGDQEREKGLPITPLFDRTKPGITKAQVGFLDVVAIPLFKALASAFEGTTPLLSGVMLNYKYWSQMEKEANSQTGA